MPGTAQKSSKSGQSDSTNLSCHSVVRALLQRSALVYFQAVWLGCVVKLPICLTQLQVHRLLKPKNSWQDPQELMYVCFNGSIAQKLVTQLRMCKYRVEMALPVVGPGPLLPNGACGCISFARLADLSVRPFVPDFADSAEASVKIKLNYSMCYKLGLRTQHSAICTWQVTVTLLVIAVLVELDCHQRLTQLSCCIACPIGMPLFTAHSRGIGIAHTAAAVFKSSRARPLGGGTSCALCDLPPDRRFECALPCC